MGTAHAIGLGLGMRGVRRRTFDPRKIPGSNLKLWLRADQGVTLSSASVNAFSAWTLSNTTRTAGQSDPDGGTGAFKLTDSVDGAPAVHTATGTLTNAVAGPAVARLWVKADAVLDQIQVQIGSTSTVAARFTFSTQAFSDIQNCTTALIETRGSWYLIELQPTIATTTPVYIVYFSVAGTSSYQGAGTRSFFAYTPTYAQDRVSQLNDQSGLANNATQGTAANQMLYRLEDGLSAFGWPLDASKTSALPSGFYSVWNGNGVPMTSVQLIKRFGTPGAASGPITLLGATAVLQWSHGATNLYADRWQDDASLNKSSNYSGTMPASWSTVVHTFDGTNARLFVDGTADAGNPHDRDVGVQTFTSAQLEARFQMRREVAVFNRVLTVAEYKAIENGMRRRGALAPV